MSKLLTKPNLLKFGFYISRFIIAFVFAYTIFNKVQHLETFAIEISNYQIIPLELVFIFSYLTLFAEAVIAISIASGWQIKWGSRLTIFLLLVFIIAIISALITGKNIDCGCTGEDTSIVAIILGTTLLHALIRDIVLTGITLYIHWYATKNGPDQITSAVTNQ